MPPPKKEGKKRRGGGGGVGGGREGIFVYVMRIINWEVFSRGGL